MTGRKVRSGLFAIAVLMCLSATDAVAACSGSGRNWSCTVGSTLQQVQAAYDAASDGATITFDAGAYSWTSGPLTLSNSKGVTLVCAVERQCVVTRGRTYILFMESLSGNNTKLYRLSGFVINGGSGTMIWWYNGVDKSAVATMNNCRVDHNTITNQATGEFFMLLGSIDRPTKFKCVIDSNIFSGPNNFISLKYLGPGNPDLYPSSVRGTADNVFLEDNVYDFDAARDPGAGCIDVWWAGSVVVRRNDSKNCLWTSHGVGHRTTVNFELYQNTLRRTTGSGAWLDGRRLFHHQGSGEMTAWGNVFNIPNPIHANALAVTHYRSAAPADAGYDGVTFGRCDGTSARDGNKSPSGTYYGYPCWMQPGRAPAGGSPGYGTLAPMYAWMNTEARTGNRVGWGIEDIWSGPPLVSTHIQANRDYYNAVSKDAQTNATTPFNGTVGMGFGTRANRPTTCTTNANESGGGVAYWATDEGEWDSSNGATPDGRLYRCSATNTWTLHYTPYPYPHPLRGQALPGISTRPTPPKNLRITPP